MARGISMREMRRIMISLKPAALHGVFQRGGAAREAPADE